MDSQLLNFKGRDVYAGIDVHKKSYSLVIRESGKIIKKASMPAEAESLARSLETWFPKAKIHTAYEAGFSGFCLHRTLIQHGIHSQVINAASVEVAANDKKKCDRRDADKLSEQLSTGRLKGIYIPNLDEELRRQITRTRDQLVQEKKRIGNQIKGKLHQFGYIGKDDDRVMSRKYLAWIKTLDLPKELSRVFDLLSENWLQVRRQIEGLKVDMQEQAFEDPEIEAVYMSVPGMGPISARVLANELGDLSKRFKNQDSLFQYTGLTPSEYSSGEHICKGNIDRQGSARIRHILVQLAWKAIRKDVALQEYFEQLAYRRGKKRAIVAVARKLIGRARACFVHKQFYQLGVVA